MMFDKKAEQHGNPSDKASTPSERSSPRYQWLHDRLLQEIEQGRFPVGSAFPTEEQLAQQYGVSRHTVREATRRLVERGLIRRRRSTGTTVTASQASQGPYVAALGSLKELMDYTHSTRLEVLSRESVVLGERLATTIDAESDSTWTVLHSHRYLIGRDQPISYTNVYLRPEYASIADRLHGEHTSIFKLHEELFGQPVYSVTQRIEASRMPAEASRRLGVSPSAPTLKMTRIYRDASGRVMSASLNYYITDRFELITHWHRNEGR